MRRVVIVLVVIALSAAVLMPSPASADPMSDCLGRANVIDVNGVQAAQYSAPAVPTDAAVDAREAAWLVPLYSGTGDEYPVYLQGNDGHNICFVGGIIAQAHDHLTSTWTAVWHKSAGFMVKNKANHHVIGTWLFNVGDGFRFAQAGADNWALSGVRATQVHDDCIENDAFNSGSVDDSYFESCYAFYSARGDTPSARDGSAETVSITNSLVRLAAMPDSEPGGPGHAIFWKLGNGVHFGNPSYPRNGRSPTLEVHDTIFRVDQRPVEGTLAIPKFDADQDGTTESSYLDPSNCSDNIIVLAGTATLTQAEQNSYAATGCFTILTGQAGLDAWDARVAAWHLAH